MVPSLPVEVFVNIASFVARADLLNFALASQRCCYAATPYLWRNIEVSIGNVWQGSKGTRRAIVLQWSVGRHVRSSDERLRHVRRFQVKELSTDTSTNVVPPNIAFESVLRWLKAMTGLEEFILKDPCLNIMPCLIDGLREIRSLTRLSIVVPIPERFRSESEYKELVNSWAQFRNLTSLELMFGSSQNVPAARIAASILFKSPHLQILKLGQAESENYRSNTTTNRDVARASIIIFRIYDLYSKLRREATIESPSQTKDGEPRHRLSGIGLVPLKRLVLDKPCLMGSDIHLFADTHHLKRLEISNDHYGDPLCVPYEGRQSVFKVLAGRAPNLVSIAFETDFIIDLGTESIDFTRDLPSFSELSIWNLNDHALFLKIMTACGGAGSNAKRWKKLLLGAPKDYSLDDYQSSRLLSFVADCTSLSHLDIHIPHACWDKLVDTVTDLPTLKEVHVHVLWKPEELLSSDSAAAQELFDCNPGLRIVMVVSKHSGTPPQFWRRGQSTSYPLRQGTTQLLDFPPVPRISITR
ncbi:hypothetical protein VTL71DRAFT_13974 [Oculimacula yallundae]|uniref:F-box domain-containing protein n=1 Tax=Oculimacula yallundae TaxID=86028 RepID=A0ABR4CLY2_9HELO